jgi:hypothetical protein
MRENPTWGSHAQRVTLTRVRILEMVVEMILVVWQTCAVTCTGVQCDNVVGISNTALPT